jgi:hypothetical protein
LSLRCVGQNIDDGLISHWRLSDGSGTVARDSVGQNHGTLMGDAAWTDGIIGGAILLDGDGDYVNCGNDASFNISNVTLAAWILPDSEFTYPDWSGIIMRGASGGDLDTFAFYYNGDTELLGFKCTGTSAAWHSFAAAALFDNEWHHVAATYDGATKVVYMDAQEVGNGASTGSIISSGGNVLLGAGRDLSPPTHYAAGNIDDARVYERALSQAEVALLMQAQDRDPGMAWSPIPADNSEDVPHTGDLAWTPGNYAANHQVYFGTSLEDVNAAAPSVLIAEDLGEPTLDPGPLEFGQTYYWRVDEVNGTADKTVYRGDIWSFTAEPYSVQIPSSAIGVTASSTSNEFSMPEKVVDGSGLGDDNIHSMTSEDMWFTASVDLDPWIQFDFDEIKKLDVMKVWNSNSPAESALGWGVKDVQIEYSVDGENWEVLADANQFSRAPGSLSYEAYDEIEFGGAVARYVRLDIQSNWGGILMSYSLSEIQFMMIPAKAREPEPASGSVDVSADAILTWRAGRGADQHTIYVGTDQNEVAAGLVPSVVSSTNSLNLGTLALELGQTYYWRVDEVNEAEFPSVWTGPVWSFSAPAFLVVADFEGYSNLSPNRPFQAWLDGFGYSADEFFPAGYGGNGTGAGVGHDIWTLSSPHYGGSVMETSDTISGSSQSMPFYYSNAGGASTTERTFADPQDWTAGGAKTLSIAFNGQVGNTGTLFIVINNTKVTYTHDNGNIGSGAWQAWNIDLTTVNTTLSNVTKLQLGVEGAGAAGMILFDDIRLYAKAGELITLALSTEEGQ